MILLIILYIILKYHCNILNKSWVFATFRGTSKNYACFNNFFFCFWQIKKTCMVFNIVSTKNFNGVYVFFSK